MGSDAELFLFDHDRYRHEVVPALVDLIRTGELAPWIADGEWGYDVEWPQMADWLRDHPADLARHCTWLGDDLRSAGARPERRLLRCPSRTCPERGRCVFHTANDQREELHALHEALVATRCLGEAQFVGRTATPDYYLPVLDRLGVPGDGPVRAHLRALGTRGTVVGYRWGSSEGIYGWLTVAETADLAVRLDRLPLPRYAPTFAGMAGQDRDRDWPALSLSFVRTVATIAAGRGRAVLWGNDVIPELWRSGHSC
ncbi:hypothetical protein [Actinoplanes sp. URMC 104]|uniref:hypothetical protein n=1 Tax=Actinoplanes sp. URMC 104 TaxID=3423409 RepID=UPI003F1965C8